MGVAATQPDHLPLLVLTKQEAADWMKVPVDTLDNLHRTKKFCGVFIGKHLRYRVRDIEAYLASLQPAGGGE